MRPLLFVLGLWAAALPLAIQAAPPLRLVADKWPPFTDTALPGQGIATALVKAALLRAGYDSALEQVPWARALAGVRLGRYDVLINAWYDPSRHAIGTFSDAYLSNRLRLLARQPSQLRIDSPNGLRGLRIAVVRGYAYTDALDLNRGLRRIEVGNFASAVQMLAAGRVDVAVEDEYAARYYLQREAADVRASLDFVGEPLGENGLRILVSAHHPEHDQIVARFESAIAAMKADGTYAQMLRQYGL